MKCPECTMLGRKSKITPLPVCISGDAPLEKFWDENRRKHVHDPNIRKQYFRCTQGHQWFELFADPCPICGWPNNEQEEEVAGGEKPDESQGTAL